MSDALEILNHLRSAGAIVRVEGEELRVRAPAGVLTEELRASLRARKREMVRLLSSYPCTSCGQHAFPEPGTVCSWCKPRTKTVTAARREEFWRLQARARRFRPKKQTPNETELAVLEEKSP